MKTKSKFLWVLLALIFVFTFAGNVSAGDGWSDNEKEPCTIMKPDRETLQRWIKDYETAPRAYIDEELALTIPLEGSYSLLSHLDYVPAERNQGSCGNCWAWAGTGVMGIALNVEEGISDRLSVQYINSCESSIIGKTCCDGGWLSDLADFYDLTEIAIPWSNTNANWQDGDASCDTPCGYISTSPNYPVALINEQSIPTHKIPQAQAIANIKNVLNQDKAVWFGYFLATGADWTNFRTFWWNQPETITWNPDFSCGHTWDDGGGHAVLCVGYNDDNPDNPYWIMVNSWGTAGSGRLNGIFRLDMNMNYDCVFYDAVGEHYSFYWQMLDIEYGAPGWEIAYSSLFDSPSDLEPLRQYRDEFLNKTPKGRLYTSLLYKRSEKALQVLLQNPELMMEANYLIDTNKDAVIQALNGNEGVIYNTDEIVSFLKAYARKSPPGLKLLANTIKWKMLIKQMQGEPFLGFTLE